VPKLYKRLIVSLACFVAVGLSGIDAFALVSRASNPRLALRVAPHDAGALISAAKQAMLDHPHDARVRTAAFEMAQSALRDQALSPAAFVLLAVADPSKSTAEVSSQRVKMALRLSQRELGAHLWLIEDGARRNDLKGVLRSYDAALRTSESAASLLMPLLVSALPDEEVSGGLVPYIKAGAPWVEIFVQTAIARDAAVAPLARLLIQSGGLKPSVSSASIERALVDRLVVLGTPLLAKDYYLTTKGADRALVTSPEFSIASLREESGLLGWQFINDAGLGASPTDGGSKNALGLHSVAAMDRHGAVARKLLFLGPGTYQLKARIGPLISGKGGLARWTLRCVNVKVSQIAWEGAWVPLAAGAALSGSASVSQDCPAQFLELSIAGGEAGTGAEFDLFGVTLQGGPQL
jgi:hypothetical protein